MSGIVSPVRLTDSDGGYRHGMNLLAFICALAAILVFLLAFLLVPSKRPLIALGLALISAAWVIAAVWQPGHPIIIH